MEIVIEFSCTQCGFDNTTMDNAALTEMIASCAARWVPPFSDVRRGRDVWSPLEYANHYRDVVAFYGERIELVLTQHRPQLSGRDFTIAPVVSDQVGAEIADATGRVVARLRSLGAEQWNRVGLGSSDGAERDIRNLASRLAHEGFHHLLDIGKSP